jgi:hypothetical protein
VDEAEEVGLDDLVGGVEVIELALAEALQDEPVVALVADDLQVSAPGGVPLRAGR